MARPTFDEVRARASGSVTECPFCGRDAFVAMLGETADRPVVARCPCGAYGEAAYGVPVGFTWDRSEPYAFGGVVEGPLTFAAAREIGDTNRGERVAPRRVLLVATVNRARRAFERIDRRRVAAFRNGFVSSADFARIDGMMLAAWRTYTALRARLGGAS